MQKEKCFACDKPLGAIPHMAETSDGQKVYVGIGCWKEMHGYTLGWQPPKGGPRLFPIKATTN